MDHALCINSSIVLISVVATPWEGTPYRVMEEFGVGHVSRLERGGERSDLKMTVYPGYY
jgi:hypothetical protein